MHICISYDTLKCIFSSYGVEVQWELNRAAHKEIRLISEIMTVLKWLTNLYLSSYMYYPRYFMHFRAEKFYTATKFNTDRYFILCREEET